MTTTVRTVMAMVVAMCFTGVGAAEAQMQQPAQPPQADADAQRAKVMDKLNTLQEQSRKVQEELSEIARKAVEANPDLVDMHSNLMTVYERKLTEYGNPSEDEMQELQVMQQKLQTAATGDMDEAERQRLTDEFNARVSKMQEAQQKAQNDPDVQKVYSEFEQKRQEAMQTVNPKTVELQQEQEQLQGELQEIQQSLQTYMQQPPQR